MPRKRKKRRLDDYDLHDVFRREASGAVEVLFHESDPGYALSARAYAGRAARAILEFFDSVVTATAEKQGWGEARRRETVEGASKLALGIFLEQLEEKLDEALDELTMEAIAQAMRDEARGAAADDPELITDSEMFQFGLAAGQERRRRRLEPPPRGPRPEWTPERRAQFLDLYEQMLRQVKGARGIYRGDQKGESWREKVAEAYPGLPASVAEKLPLRGFKPSDLARAAAAELMGLTPSEYLTRVLVQARREASRASGND